MKTLVRTVSSSIQINDTTFFLFVVSHKPSIKEESMEAHKSTPNMEDGRVDVSSAIFEEKDTNDGDFGKDSTPICMKFMTFCTFFISRAPQTQ